ncbi:MAG: pilus assembly protein TadG-related protein [Armatimonadota bacterium]
MRKIYSHNNQNGGILVFLAIVLIVLLGMAALAIDLGQLYIAKQKAQNVCDMSALAGAWLMDPSVPSSVTANPTNPGPAEKAAKDCALANNKDETGTDDVWLVYEKDSTTTQGVTVSFPTTTRIKAEGQVPVKYAFAGIFGADDRMVSASAIVELNMVTTLTTNMIPIAVNESMIDSKLFGEVQTLKGGTWQQGFIGSGNWSPISFKDPYGNDENGANIYRERLQGEGDPVTVSIGDTLNTNPGNMVQPTIQGISPRLDDSTWDAWVASYGEFANYADTSRIVLVPVIEDPMLDLSGRSDVVTVIGFAAFYLESVTSPNDSTGGNAYPQLTARLIGGAVGEDSIRWTQWLGTSGMSSTLFSPRLVE